MSLLEGLAKFIMAAFRQQLFQLAVYSPGIGHWKEKEKK
jgi:hypothetical protein